MYDKDKVLKKITHDTLYDGRIILEQPQKGYRFSVDSPLLTWFACEGREASSAVDLGAGCGVVGLGLLAAEQARRVVAVEVQPALASLAVRNAELNGFSRRYQVSVSDVRNVQDGFGQGDFDLVISNPPFWPRSSGRLPSDEERRVACHAVLGNLRDWIEAASYLLNSRHGRLCVVYPARRMDELLMCLDGSRLSATRIVLVHPLPNKPAELVLVEARTGGPGRVTVAPQVTLKNTDGTDTKEAESILRGAFSAELEKRPDKREN